MCVCVYVCVCVCVYVCVFVCLFVCLFTLFNTWLIDLWLKAYFIQRLSLITVIEYLNWIVLSTIFRKRAKLEINLALIKDVPFYV